ncbi:MAG: TetR/AcrR family transcriptional regulator [Deltaproteobacteria bacterium]|nr:TetR/AcrR family transcriptional regulator [Deltaproteobacteria bacterium]
MKVCRVKGFHNATIREIAKASGMSLGNIYDYIEKKEDILFLIHKEVLDQIYARMEKIIEKHEDSKDQFNIMFTELFSLTMTLKEEMLFIYTETKSLPKEYLHEVLKKESDFVNRYAKVIENSVRRGAFQCEKPELFANIVTFMSAILPLRGWNILQRNTPDEVCKVLLDMASNYLNQ